MSERGEAERERLKGAAGRRRSGLIEEYSTQLKENVSTINYLNSRENDKVLRGLTGSTAASGVLSSLFPASTASLTTSIPNFPSLPASSSARLLLLPLPAVRC